MPDEDRKEIRRRSFWSGTVTFGLVSIPVALFPGNRGRRVRMRMLAPDGTPLARRYFCPAEDRPVDREEIIRGFEIEKGKFVTVTDEELEALQPEKSREIDLRRFVPVEQIDPMLFDRAYFLAPSGDSQKPYRLLAETMEKTGRAGIATFVMRDKEYLVAILAENGILRAETLRFADEIRTPEAIDLPEPQEAAEELSEVVEEAIRAAEAPDIDREELRDDYADRLLELVERKRAAGKDVVAAIPDVAGEAGDEEDNVIDLMEVLKKSMAEENEKRFSGRQDGAEDELEHLSRKELYDRAKELDISGRSAMTRKELIEAIHGSA